MNCRVNFEFGEGNALVRQGLARVLDVLTTAETFELVSINPDDAGPYPPDGWEVERTAVLEPGSESRNSVVAAIQRAIAEYDGSPAACFIPHHGVRATRGADMAELVICFMCKEVRVYLNGASVGNEVIGPSAAPILDSLLLGVPQAPTHARLAAPVGKAADGRGGTP